MDSVGWRTCFQAVSLNQFKSINQKVSKLQWFVPTLHCMWHVCLVKILRGNTTGEFLCIPWRGDRLTSAPVVERTVWYAYPCKWKNWTNFKWPGFHTCNFIRFTWISTRSQPCHCHDNMTLSGNIYWQKKEIVYLNLHHYWKSLLQSWVHRISDI